MSACSSVLMLTAHKRGLNMSVLANKILDANLPHFELRQIDKPSDKTAAAGLTATI